MAHDCRSSEAERKNSTPAPVSVYYNRKHDIDFGFIKAIIPYNFPAIALDFVELLRLTAWNCLSGVLLVITAVLFAVLSAAIDVRRKERSRTTHNRLYVLFISVFVPILLMANLIEKKARLPIVFVLAGIFILGFAAELNGVLRQMLPLNNYELTILVTP